MPFKYLTLTHKRLWLQRKQPQLAVLNHLGGLLRAGDTVLEVGGHIGFTTQFLATRVGGHGQVHAFEPGQQNRDFLCTNIRTSANATHINAAVSGCIGKAPFYEERAGGFHSALNSDFAQMRARLSRKSALAEVAVRDVHTVTIDHYATQHGLRVDALCIDAEGAELEVLHAATTTLRTLRVLMLTVTKNHKAVYDLLEKAGFALRTPEGQLLTSLVGVTESVFATRDNH
ncbi:FkbM family methyltransferase [Loktanella sp. Alg231-35]|uniref:FkbM family methyltransferase n=1 Tax=Loktanella sp. Alg231-35 TaxID=1922220 RepID=UPI00131F4832|nr:FkbM family methyltransferase [Loktanella sp. Alg231-35]